MTGFCCNKKMLNKKCSIVAILAVLAGGAALWFVWFGSASLINKEIVDGTLQRLSTQISEFAQAHGKDAKLTYGEIEINGWGYNKKAVVHSPAVEVSVKGGEVTKTWSASTDSVIVESDPVNAERVLLSVANPINVNEDGKLKDVISFSEPLKYAYTQLHNDGGLASQQDFFVPKQITISQESAGEVVANNPANNPDCANSTSPDCAAKAAEDKPIEAAKNQTVINFAKTPTLQLVSSAESAKRSVSYDFSGLEVSSNDGNKVAIGSVVGNFNKEDGNGEGKFAVKYAFSLGDIVVSDSNHSSKPYSFNVDMAVANDEVASKESTATQAPAAASTEAAVSPVAPTPADAATEAAKEPVLAMSKKFTINDVALSGQDFKLHAKGDVSIESDDQLPSGLVTFQIDNLQQFLGSELVPAEVRGVVEGLLEKMTGQPVAKLETLSIPFKREKNGVFYLGQTTFESLAATFLSDVLMSRPAGEPAVNAPVAGAAPVGSVVSPAPAASVAPAPVSAVGVPAPVSSVASPAPAVGVAPVDTHAVTSPAAPAVVDPNAAPKVEGVK